MAVRASEPIDSGWTIARPQTVLETKHTDNPQIRIAINHVLEQGQTPLLQSPAQQRPQQQPVAAQPELVPDEIADLPVESTADKPAEEVESNDDVETDDGPTIVFGNYGTSADGWRPADLSADRPRSANAHEPSAVTPVGPRFRPVSSDASKSTTAPAESGAVKKPSPIVRAVEEPAAKPTIDAKTFDESADNESQREDESEDSSDAGPIARPLVDTPTEPLPPLTQNMKNLRAKVRRVIKSYYTRPLNSRDNDPWELMHGMLAYGVHSKIRQGSPRGETITLVGWLCYNKPSKGMTLLYLTPENELRAKQGVGLQGHMGQFLAMLAQCQVSPDYPIRVRNQEFAISDLIEAEKKTCYPRSELTFKLIALMHYIDSDSTWVNDQGQSWDIPRLIREELAQPIRGAACGGTHRLSGLSLAARTRVRRGEPLDGEYLRAAQFVEKYQNYAFQLQNRDGSLSTEWFRGRGEEDDIDRRVKTTGHILEWLCYSLPEKDVRSARTFRATNYLSSLLSSNFNHEWEVGPLGHAIHALRLYDERVFQPYDGQDDVAKKPIRKTARRPAPTVESRSTRWASKLTSSSPRHLRFA